ncbi:MAG: hypothetical protein NSGCLCUN01_03940 [uncultured Clostridium sp.]
MKMKKVIVPAYKYNKAGNTVVDRYICSKCSELVNEEKRLVEGKRKHKRNSIIYYTICTECKSKK